MIWIRERVYEAHRDGFDASFQKFLYDLTHLSSVYGLLDVSSGIDPLTHGPS